jgi:arabinan endo-1,5-alpha-L-arabinosidase
VIEVAGRRYIFYGSYFGGISARLLSPDGRTSDPATQVQITIPNRYEGAHVVAKDGWFYLFASATDCCRGPLTGYSVFVGRSRTILGPYLDREGVSLLDGRVGGTPFLSMNGNAFVGPGHNFLVEDFAGQWWTYYHAVDRFEPYFAGAVGFTKRPLMLDAVDWVDGWPTVRGGAWISDRKQHGPAAQPGDRTTYRPPHFKEIELGKAIPELSDEFNGTALGAQWTWIRPPSPGTYSLTGSTLRWDTQTADLFEGSNSASVLVERAPKHDYVVELKVALNVPPEGCCFNYTQAGGVVYRDDDNFVKLVHFSLWDTRQTEFAKEWFPVPAGWPRYGNTVVGPPGDWTYLRIARCERRSNETYLPYTSRDGTNWVRGGTWTHDLGAAARIGLVSMGRNGDVPVFTANFDYVRVYRAEGCP